MTITDAVRSSALQHAQEEAPRESCGLVLLKHGKLRYHRCGNLSPEPELSFVIDPADWVEAEDSNSEVVAIIHSHPNTPATPSQADRVVCEQWGLPWHIVNPQTGAWGYCEPCGYRAPLLGRPWVWGATDCWSLCRDWYAEVLRIELRDWERPIDPADFNADPMFERCFRDTGFRELRKDEELQPGDLLLMSIASDKLNHIGVYVGDQRVLHHLGGRLSSKDIYGGWLLECTGKRLRYAPRDPSVRQAG